MLHFLLEAWHMLPGGWIDIQRADAGTIQPADDQLPQLLVTRTVPAQPRTICSQQCPEPMTSLQLL